MIINRLKIDKYSSVVFLFILVLSIQSSSHLNLDRGVYFRIALIAVSLFIGLVFLFFRYFKKSVKLYLDDIAFFYLAFLLYAGVSIFWANTCTLAIPGLLKLFLFFIIFVLLVNYLNRNQDHALRFIIKAIIVAFLLSLYPFYRQVIQLSDLSYDTLYRLNGISGHKNLYASFVFLTSLGSCLGWFYLKGQRFWRILAIISFILQLLLIIVLRSRAVYIACLVTLAAYFILVVIKFKNVSRKKVLLLSFGLSVSVALFFIFIFPYLLERYSGFVSPSRNIEKLADTGTLSERILVWQKSYNVINDHLFFGAGLGNWKVSIARYSLPDIYRVQDMNVVFQRPHNEFVKIFAEVGIIGFFLFIFLLSYFILRMIYLTKQAYENKASHLLSGLIGFLCIMFFSFPLERIEHCLIGTFLLSISVYFVKSNISSQRDGANISFSGKLLAIPVFFLFFILMISLSRYQSAYYLKKMYYERNLGHHEKVVRLCDSAITSYTKMDDFGVPVHWYRGNAYADMQKYNQALTDFQQAYAFHPFHAHVLNDLGSAYYLHDNIDSALYFYKRSAFVNPRFDEPKLNMVAIYIHLDKYQKAKKWEQSLVHDSKRRNQYRKMISDWEQKNNQVE